MLHLSHSCDSNVPVHGPETGYVPHNHRRMSIQWQAALQQYLSPPDEKGLVCCFVRISYGGYRSPIKDSRDLADVIVPQRTSRFQTLRSGTPRAARLERSVGFG